MIFGVADDDDSAAAGFDFVSLGDAFFGVVGALGMKIGTDFADYCADIFFREDHDGIDVRQRSEDLGALVGWHRWPSLSLQSTHRGIGIDRDDELASEFASGVKIADVANVQYIEAAVGERYAIASGTPGRCEVLEFFARNDFWMTCTQCSRAAAGVLSSASSNSCWLTVAVPRFITTMPPA